MSARNGADPLAPRIALCDNRDPHLPRPLSPLARACEYLEPLTVTVLIEAAAVRGIGWNWRYSDLMPRLPPLGTGLSPVLQWLILPPLMIRLVRGQLRSS